MVIASGDIEENASTDNGNILNSKKAFFKIGVIFIAKNIIIIENNKLANLAEYAIINILSVKILDTPMPIA